MSIGFFGPETLVSRDCVRESFKTPSLACQVDSTLWVILIAQGSRLFVGKLLWTIKHACGGGIGCGVCVIRLCV